MVENYFYSELLLFASFLMQDVDIQSVHFVCPFNDYVLWTVIYHQAASHACSAKMRPIVMGVTWSVCLLDTTMSCAKTAEPIKMPFVI